eukprot:RCo000518
MADGARSPGTHMERCAMKNKPQLHVHAAPRTTPSDAVSTNTRTFQITDTGTLKLELPGGLPVEVRQRGAELGPQQQQLDHVPGSLLSQIKWADLKIGHIIGEGNQATVRKVKHVETEVIYAMKSIDLTGHK